MRTQHCLVCQAADSEAFTAYAYGETLGSCGEVPGFRWIENILLTVWRNNPGDRECDGSSTPKSFGLETDEAKGIRDI